MCLFYKVVFYCELISEFDGFDFYFGLKFMSDGWEVSAVHKNVGRIIARLIDCRLGSAEIVSH